MVSSHTEGIVQIYVLLFCRKVDIIIDIQLQLCSVSFPLECCVIFL